MYALDKKSMLVWRKFVRLNHPIFVLNTKSLSELNIIITFLEVTLNSNRLKADGGTYNERKMMKNRIS